MRSVAILCLAFALVGCSKNTVKEPTADNLFQRGKNAWEAGRLDVAKSRLLLANKKRPNHFATVNLLVRINWKEGNYKNATTLAQNYADSKIEDPRGYEMLADAQLKRKMYPQAVQTLTELVELDEKSSAAYERRGRAHLLAGNTDASLMDLKRAVTLDPKDGQARASYGAALYKTGKRRDAVRELKKAVAISPKQPRAHRTLGTVLRDRGEIRGAIKHHKIAAELAPSDPAVHFELGLTLNFIGRNVESEQSLVKARKLDERNPLYCYAHGEILRTLKRYKEAINAYEQTIRLEPNHKKAPAKLGVVLFYDGKLEEAEAYLTTAIRNHPKNPYPYLNIGYVYEAANKKSLAINAFEKFLELAPKEDGDRKVAKKRISKLSR